MSCNVKWANALSREFRVPLGIKQGGINSPDYFGCYIDDLCVILRNSHVGCYMYKIFLAMTLFADDLCLLAPTRYALDRLIQLCESYCKEHGLTFNAIKSKIVVFSKSNVDLTKLAPILLNGNEVEYVQCIVYLGTTIVNNKGFAFSSANDLSKFYRASNSILRAVRQPSEEILMHLLFPSRQMQDCCTAVNDALRLIFGYNRWESVRVRCVKYG